MTPFPHLKVSGSPSDLGLSYGSQAKALIQRNTAAYKRLVTNTGLRGTPKILSRYRASLQAHTPDLLQTLDATANAASVDPQDLLLLNTRSELLALSGAWSPTECTSLALERAADNHPRVAQNWDWLHEMKGCQIVLEAHPDNHPAFLSFCEAGHLAKISVNEYGLAVGLNFLIPPADTFHAFPDGLPVHVLLRHILRAASVPEALQILRETPRGGGANFMLADPHGNIASVEFSPTSVETLPNSGPLTHANDYEALSQAHKPLRSARLALLLASSPTPLDDQTLFTLLRDHKGPESICGHPQGPGTSASLASLVLNPQALSLSVSPGLPCQQNPVTTLSLPRKGRLSP